MRIPIIMGRGLAPTCDPPFDAEHCNTCLRMVHELGFETISYDQLAAWKFGGKPLPDRPIMFDFDHPVRSTHQVIFPLMTNFGFTGKETLSFRQALDRGSHVQSRWCRHTLC